MTKMFIAEIGYQKYTISPDDATTLLKIVDRSRLVKQINYAGRYYVQAEQEPWITGLSMADVVPEFAVAPDKPGQPTVPTPIDELPF